MQVPRGILIPIGGGEDKEGRKSILNRLIDETRRREPSIEIITTATDDPEEVGNHYIRAFRDIGIRDIGTIDIHKRDEACDERYMDRLKRCDAVLFSGGDQLKLSTLLGGTAVLRLIQERYCDDDDFVVAGSSAGAAAMSATMIVSGSSRDALIKGELQLTNGLNFINNVFIDTHVTQRGRVGRLIQTVASNPAVLGLGLGEDTGAVIYDGRDVEIIGSGLVVIVDGGSIRYSDLTEVSDGEAITIEGLKLHVLSRGRHFDLQKRRLIR